MYFVNQVLFLSGPGQSPSAFFVKSCNNLFKLIHSEGLDTMSEVLWGNNAFQDKTKENVTLPYTYLEISPRRAACRRRRHEGG